MANNFVNLHTHTSHGSWLDGLGAPDAYMARAAELGMPALAITDHGNISSILDFYEAGKKHGVKPILGIEAYQARGSRFDRGEIEKSSGKSADEFEQRGPHHMTVLARNFAGYKNLIKLSSEAYLTGHYGKPRIDLELLAEYAEGLIATSACLSGKIPQAILRDDYDYALKTAGEMQDILGKDHFLIEVQDHGIDDQRAVIEGLEKIAQTIGARVVPTCDAHYVHPSDHGIHDLMLAIATGTDITNEDRFRFPSDRFHLASYQEMATLFPEQWLRNTVDVAEMCELELEFGELHFPHFEIPTGQDSVEYFHEQIWAGLKHRYGEPLSDEVIERAEYEIGVIERMGFREYFLIVADVVQWAKNNGIRVAPGRGSAAGSVVSYALNITGLDPLYFNLRFERFLTEGRGSMPDIDLDIDERYRDQVIEYTRQKYGIDHVSHIVTFNEVRARSAIRDAARALGYSYDKGDEAANFVPDPVMGFEYSIDESMETNPDMRKACENDSDIKDIIRKARGLEGIVRQTSVHAGGIVIAPDEITEYVPLMQRPEKDGTPGTTTTQWDMYKVELVGLLKMDYLGLRNLAVIDMCFQNLKKRLGIELHEESIPWDDEPTYEMLRQGNSMGCFQVEGAQMRDLMVRLQPENVHDLAALVALYRPGPLGAGIDKELVKRKHGVKPATPVHPLLADSLNESQGLMLYQEQIIDAARILAGFSPQGGDSLRKITGKKLQDKMPQMREDFVLGCQNTHGIDAQEAHKIFDAIEGFGSYGFNKAHAASYGLITYHTAYLKANYPADYMAALLTSTKTKDKAAPYLNECRRMGIDVVAPSVNRSSHEFTVEDDRTIVFGLDSVDGVGEDPVEEVVEARKAGPFGSVHDFFRRVSHSVLNKKTVDHFTMSGALDDFFHVDDSPLSYDDIQHVLGLERQELGLYVSRHPVEDVDAELAKQRTCTLERLHGQPDGMVVTVGGVLTATKKKRTKRGKDMWLLTLEDLTGSIEVLVFGGLATTEEFETGELVVLVGKVKIEGDEQKSAKLILFERNDVPKPRSASDYPLYVKCDTYLEVQIVMDAVYSNEGSTPMWVGVDSGNDCVILEMPVKVESESVKDELATQGLDVRRYHEL